MSSDEDDSTDNSLLMSSVSSAYFSSSDDSDDDDDDDDITMQMQMQNVPSSEAVDGEIVDIYSDGDGDGDDCIGNNPLMGDIEYRLQTSIFYVEPVTHITCQLMFVDSVSNTLTQVSTRIMRLATHNTIDRFDIGRIIKSSRYAPDGSLKFRLGSLFVYNAHVLPAQLSLYVTNPDAFSFVTPLTSISSFIIKPTMACFHSLNSIHVVLHSIGVLNKPKIGSTQTSATRRTITITKTALATRRNKAFIKSKYHPR